MSRGIIALFAVMTLLSGMLIAPANVFAQSSGIVKQVIDNGNLQLYIEDVKVNQSSTVKTVSVSIIFKNLDFKPQLFNQFFMKLKDSEGREYSPEFDSNLPSAYIPSLDIARGTAVFEIPASASPSRFYYTEFFQGELVVDLTQTKATADEPPKSDWVYSSNKGFKADDGNTEITINDERYSGEYYILDITIRNVGDDKISYNPFYANVKDSKGNVYSHDFFFDLASPLSSGELVAGDFVRGDLVFEVGSQPSDGLMFIWTSELGFGSYINTGTLTVPLPEPEEEEDAGGFGDLLGSTVSGRYVDEEAGLEITFPDGWSGLTVLGVFPMVAPGGIDFSSEQEATMVILPIALESIDDLWNDPEVLEDVQTGTESEVCTTISTSFTTINGIRGMETVQECNSSDGYRKTKALDFLTAERLVVIDYSAPSEALYEQHLDEFDDSLQTLQISGALDFESALADILSLQTENHAVMALGKPVDVSIRSNSQVSDVRLDEAEKRLSFRVEGEDGTQGTSIIAVDSVLEPPYTVTVDGQVWDDVSDITVEGSGERLLLITYSHSIHDVAITGANVVPEFPIGILAAVGVIMTGIVAMSRFYKRM